jgi:hypothetical protein
MYQIIKIFYDRKRFSFNFIKSISNKNNYLILKKFSILIYFLVLDKKKKFIIIKMKILFYQNLFIHYYMIREINFFLLLKKFNEK